VHREFHPADMHHLRAHAFDAGGPREHHGHDDRSLYAMTAILGGLIGADVVFEDEKGDIQLIVKLDVPFSL